MNSVCLTGRLVRDPDVKYGGSDSSMAIARFNIAVDRKYKKDGDEQTADFPSIICFGKTAEFIEKYFSKGMKIEITGRIQTGSYTNKEGQKVYTTDVVADSVAFAESKSTSNNSNSAVTVTNSKDFEPIPEGIEEELPF